MKLESARDVKASLIDKLFKGAILPAAKIHSFSAAAVGFAAAPRNQATLAVGITRKGKSEYRVAVRLQQRSLESQNVVASIKKQARGEADIRYIGRVHPMAWYRDRQRPLLIGSSVGHVDVTAGTIGCFVKNASGSGKMMILSNNHILADEGEGKKGDAIIQPGDLDGGTPATGKIATLTRYIPFEWEDDNFIDAAVATLKTGIKHDLTTLKGLGALASAAPVDLDIGDEVRKIGRTTGLTFGRVSAIEVDNVFVDYDNGRASFDRQIEIESTTNDPFSQGGDSGSLIVTADFKPGGLLFAGSDHGGANELGVTYANPIKRVLKDLKIKIVV